MLVPWVSISRNYIRFCMSSESKSIKKIWSIYLKLLINRVTISLVMRSSRNVPLLRSLMKFSGKSYVRSSKIRGEILKGRWSRNRRKWWTVRVQMMRRKRKSKISRNNRILRKSWNTILWLLEPWCNIWVIRWKGKTWCRKSTRTKI